MAHSLPEIEKDALRLSPEDRARLDGLGLRFLSAVEETADRVSAHPEAGAPLGGEFHKRIVPGFPYNIIYRVWEDYIYLVAVAHQHRRPGYWRGRTDRR